MPKLKITEKFGVIPNDILNNPQLSLKAKGLWVYMQSKPDGWEWSINGICAQTKDGYDSVKKGIDELIESKLLNREIQNTKHGRVSVYSLSHTWKSPTWKTPTGKSPTGKPHDGKTHTSKKEEVNKTKVNKTIEIDTKVSIDNTSVGLVKQTDSPIKQYGNSDINFLFTEWERITGLKISSNVKKNRNYANNLLKRGKREDIVKLIEIAALAHSDRFAPTISDFISLHNRLNELLIWAKKQGPNSNNKAIRIR